ncbi:MAG: SDR family oxidoreductase [Desulfofustis sp.]|nr:SDR family oxidoreductase [Desulfofustis sp.]
MSRKILIYGGTGGIGSEIGRLLQGQGDEVYLVGRHADKAPDLVSMDRVHFISGDVTSEGVFDQVMEEVGSELNGLVYAVGSINLGSLRRLGAEDFARDFQLNAMAAALAVKAALTPMKKGGEGGAIVLFSSVAAIQGFPMHASVGMAKGAVAGLTLALAAELAPRIRVNAIAPSLTRTPLAQSLLSNEEAAEALAAQHPLNRLGLPEDIAHLAVFLLSPEAGWMSGQIVSADGGRSSLQTGR